MKSLQVQLSDNRVSVCNDGNAIPVQLHKKHNIYVAQLIFGQLLTSSNYEDSDKKLTGGRNGYGAKLTNIFSKYFSVEVGDATSRQSMKIEWTNNMHTMQPYSIAPYSGRSFTKVTFEPDFQRFGMVKFSKNMLSLMRKRVYDMAGVLKVKVCLNNQQIKLKGFKEYVEMYKQNAGQHNILVEANKRWEVCAQLSEGQFHQVSFVNSICTPSGGTHVAHVLDQIIEKIIDTLSKSHKKLQVKPFHVKQHLCIYVNALIQNPSFDSQTKQCLTTPPQHFGSACILSQSFFTNLFANGILQHIVTLVKSKESTKIERELKKSKGSNRLIIPKLQDANLVGSSNGCTLILTEGDSAKALAMCGIEELGRDYFGVYPLRGKLPNVKEMTPKQIMENIELSNIVKIVGLSFSKVYTNTDALRYSCVMIMADQDCDGSHIKGLVINFFQEFWPSLCTIKGFLKQFITPIIKCLPSNPQPSLTFFSQTDFNAWRDTQPNHNYKIKYYKGLGTSTNKEAKEYFSDLEKHVITFSYDDSKDKEAIELAFNKKKANERKRWLQSYNTLINVDYTQKILKVENFVNQQLIHFSISDNLRSIPSVMDGLKPSQRKIIFACFKRNLKNEIKVAQLAGYVAQHSAYHHGEVSLHSTIIAMAQNYVGSNNLNLLQPIGQFGTRHMQGKDSASERYIYTRLNTLTRLVFNEADDHVVEYLQDDGMEVEPRYYVPILPLVLVNGCEGIGTGWSTTVHPRTLASVLRLVRARIKGHSIQAPVGWEKYKGKVQPSKDGWVVKGLFTGTQQVTISQIPIHKSIRDYKSFLQSKIVSPLNQDHYFEDIKEYHYGDNVQFQVTFLPQKVLCESELESFLKLSSNLQQNNMNLFDSNSVIHKYKDVEEIMEQFYAQRIKAYTRRKLYLISKFERQCQILSNKIRFLKEVIEGKFKMMEKKQTWIKQLQQNNYLKSIDFVRVKSTKNNQCDENNDNNNYNYLLSLPIWSFCSEKIAELSQTRDQLLNIIEYYQKASQIQMWEKDLNQFEEVWNNREETTNISSRNKKRTFFQGQNKKETKRRKRQIQIENQQCGNTNKKIYKSANEKKSFMKQEKSKQIIVQKLMRPPEIEVKKTSVEYLLEKYLKPSLETEGMSLSERIKARISKGDSTFEASYQSTFKEQKPKEEQRKQDLFDL